MMPRASAGSGWLPALVAAQMSRRWPPPSSTSAWRPRAPPARRLHPRPRLSTPDAADAARRQAIADRGARHAIGELVHQGANVRDLDAARERDFLDLAIAHVAQQAGHVRGAARQPQVVQHQVVFEEADDHGGGVHERRRQGRVQARGLPQHGRVGRRVQFRRANGGAQTPDEIFGPRAHAGSFATRAAWRFRK